MNHRFNLMIGKKIKRGIHLKKISLWGLGGTGSTITATFCVNWKILSFKFNTWSSPFILGNVSEHSVKISCSKKQILINIDIK